MCASTRKLHLVGLTAMIVACSGGGDDGLSPAAPEETVIPVSEYNGTWTITARDTAGCRGGVGFTVTFGVSMSNADTTGPKGFAPSGLYYVTDTPMVVHTWTSDSLTGSIIGLFARKIITTPTVTVSLRHSSQSTVDAAALFLGNFDRQRTATGELEDISPPLFSDQPCYYPAVAVRQ